MEVDKLHSRLDQQSNLICMLKQRNDKILLELSEATNKYEVSKQHMESLQQSLAKEMTQRKLMEKRFQDLAENHQQMIRLKDEYKAEAKGLRERAGQEEQGQQKTLQLEEKVLSVQREGRERLREAEVRLSTSEAQAEAAQRKMDDFQKKMNEMHQKHSDAIQQLQTNLKVCEEKVAGTRYECSLKQEEIQHLQSKLLQFSADLQASTAQLKHAELRNASLEEEIASLQAKDKARAEKLSKDAVVCDLKAELAASQENLLAVRKDYAAYRSHSAELLAHERKLNQQLRHLLE